MNKMDNVCEWLEFAKNDYIAAQHLFNDIWPKQLFISAYHCQQCAEKALKAYLIYKDIEPPYTHDLNTLRDLCAKEGVGFDKYKTAFADLTEYALQTRYPGRIDIPEKDVGDAIETAREIYEFAVKHIPELNENQSAKEPAPNLKLSL